MAKKNIKSAEATEEVKVTAPTKEVEQESFIKEESPVPAKTKKTETKNTKAPEKKSKKAPKENSLKPKKASEKAPAPAPADEKKEEEAKAPEAEQVNPVKNKKKVTEKPEIATIPAASTKGIDNLPAAKMFPAVIDHPELGKLIAAVGKYTTYAELTKALEEGKTLYFAAYWTKRQIKEFNYESTYRVHAPKTGFPLDLDILMAIVPCETIERVICMSNYTEAVFAFEGNDLEYVEDTDPRGGDNFKIRVSSGMEFEIYEPAEETNSAK